MGPAGRIGIGIGVALGIAGLATAAVVHHGVEGEKAADGPVDASPARPTGSPTNASIADATSGARMTRPGFVTANGDDLQLDGAPFRAYGFNYTYADMLGTTEYFEDPTPAGLARVRDDFREAASLGANTLRVTLELFDFVERGDDGRVRVRRDRLDAYRRVLEEAERAGIKLDVTGNLAWKPNSTPAWYDSMDDRDRWGVQATFWRDVAAVGADSPAILAYEITSEPVVKADPDASWYNEPYGGLHFIQTIARDATYANADATMRDWARTMRDAIRSSDPDHLVGVGLLNFTEGSASAGNLAREVDLLMLHDYPSGSADDPDAIDPFVATAKEFASHGKPVILGETFALEADIPTQERYLRAITPILDGALSFYDGRTPSEAQAEDLGTTFYRDNLRSFLSLSDELSKAGPAASVPTSEP